MTGSKIKPILRLLYFDTLMYLYSFLIVGTYVSIS